MIKISIVIPVFNAENYIIKCLESILNQTFGDYEVILINDGSTDGTLAILNQYLSVNKKIILINQENQGQSVARNQGIIVSKGKYLMFVDNDDYLSNNLVLEDMYNEAESYDTDVLMGDNYGKIIEFENGTGSDFFIMLNKLNLYYCNIYGKLYKADLIKNNDLYFTPNLINEDEIWTPKVYFFAKNVRFVNKLFYNRYIHENSQTRIINEKTSFRKAMGRLIVISELILFSYKNNVAADFRACLNSIFVGFFFTSINYYAVDIYNLGYAKKIKFELKKTLDLLVVFEEKIPSKSYKLKIIKIIGLENFLLYFTYLINIKHFLNYSKK